MYSVSMFVCVELQTYCNTLVRTNFFRYDVHPRVRQGELKTHAGARFARSKSFVGEGGKSLLQDLRPARADPVFKSRLDSRKREETFELQNRAVGANTAAAAAAGLSGK